MYHSSSEAIQTALVLFVIGTFVICGTVEIFRNLDTIFNWMVSFFI